MPPTCEDSVNLPSLKAPAPPRPQDTLHGAQDMQALLWLRDGQWPLIDVPALFQQKDSQELLGPISKRGKMPAGPPPTMMTSYVLSYYNPPLLYIRHEQVSGRNN